MTVKTIEAELITKPAAPNAPSDRLSPVLYTANDLAKLLQVSRRQVWRMEADGRLPKAVRLGNLTRWSKRLIECWLADRCPTRRATR